MLNRSSRGVLGLFRILSRCDVNDVSRLFPSRGDESSKRRLDNRGVDKPGSHIGAEFCESSQVTNVLEELSLLRGSSNVTMVSHIGRGGALRLLFIVIIQWGDVK